MFTPTFHRTDWPVAAAIFLFVINGWLQAWPLGLLGIIALLFGAMNRLLRSPAFGRSFWERFAFGLPLIILVPTVLIAIPYFLGASFTWSVAFLALIVFVASLFLLPQDKLKLPRIALEWNTSNLWLGVSLLGSIFLLLIFFNTRTGEAIISPWNSFTIEPFVLLGLALIAYCIGARKSANDTWLLAAIPLTFAMLSVSAIMYVHGFGFDPFLHRAAEEALLADGVIHPRQLLYSGQYLFVGLVSILTSIDVKWIDIWLVPLFAAVWLPATIYLGLHKGWSLTKQHARLLWLVAFLIPFQLLTFTVPFTITFVFFVGCVFLFPLAITSKRIALLLFLACVGLSLFHPLLTVPLGVLFFVMLVRRTHRRAGPVLAGVGVAISIPVLLFLYLTQTGQPINLSSLTQNISSFFSLWGNPYWDPYPIIPLFLDLIYELRYLLPFFFAGIAAAFLVLFRKEERHQWFAVFWIGLLACIYLTSTLFTFKDIIIHEQHEFALRLLHAWFVFALPFVAVLASRLIPKRFGFAVVSTLLTLMVVHSCFFSYPQYNVKFPFYSPGVGEEDVEAVHWIDGASDGDDYVVLSNQMLSAAAIQEFGFAYYYPLAGEEVLWYAIPTGGVLYAQFIDLLAGRFDDERASSLIDELGVTYIFVVLPTYYSDTLPDVVGGLETLAKTVHELETITIYQFAK